MTARGADAVRLPDVPLMVAATGPPTAAPFDAVSVRMLELVAGLGEKAAVTPLGNPDADSVTPPAKPLAADTDMVLTPLPPSSTVTLAGDDES